MVMHRELLRNAVPRGDTHRDDTIDVRNGERRVDTMYTRWPGRIRCVVLLLLCCRLLVSAAPSDTHLKQTGWIHQASKMDMKRPDVGWSWNGSWQMPATTNLISVCTGAAPVLKCAERDIYEFGVYTGRYMRMHTLVLARSGVEYRKFWGFDSFQGLPPEDRHSRPQRVHWREGQYNAAEVYGTYSSDELQSKIKSYINNSRVELVQGFYNESLTAQLVKRMRPALYVEIDCDLYISTLQALDWMLANRLIVNGTVIGYDDLRAGGAGGERQAHMEMASKYGMRSRWLSPSVLVVDGLKEL